MLAIPPTRAHLSLTLFKLCEAPQPLQERWALLKNIALVNRAWLALAARVSCQDVHTSSTRHAYAFLRLLVGRPPGQNTDDLFTTEGSQFANEVCHFITFYVDGSVPKESSDPLSTARDTAHATADDASNAIRLVLDTLPIRNYLPNLRHISFRYTDWDYGDVFAHLERGTFPQHVTSLSIHYSFSDAKGPDLHGSSLYLMALDWMNARDRDRDLARKTGKGGPGVTVCAVRVPTLRHLSLSEVTTGFGEAILEVCPNVETLDIVSGPIRVWGLPPLPPSARTLVLRPPNPALSWEETIRRWGLHGALRDGLFPKGAIRPQIIVRSGLPKPVEFAALRRICEHYDVELVYERDDALNTSFKHD